MKRELELIQELTELSAAKVEAWGSLPEAHEKRFQELKSYYDELMARREYQKIPPSERYQAEELKNLLPRRDALRVPLGMHLFFCHGQTYAPARTVNLSHGGIFVGSSITMEPGAQLTLYMPNLGRGYEHLFETAVDVIWSTTGGGAPHRGMGVRFHDLEERAENELDDFIVSFLKHRLSRTNPAVVRSRYVTV